MKSWAINHEFSKNKIAKVEMERFSFEKGCAKKFMKKLATRRRRIWSTGLFWKIGQFASRIFQAFTG